MLVLDKVSIRLTKEDHRLVDHLSFTLNPGDKYAIIGHEGTGKSTVLKELAGVEPLDYIERQGTIICQGKIGYLDQDIKAQWQDCDVESFFLKETPSAAINPDYYQSWHRIAALLEDVGFSQEAFSFEKKLSDFSGGEVIKLGIVRLLFHDYDLFLLDEPTNDLDFPTIAFLEQFMLTESRPILFVSHDVRLLERVANGIIHIQRTHKHTDAQTYFEKIGYADYRDLREKHYQSRYQIAVKERQDHQRKLARWRAIYQSVEHAQNQAVRTPSTARLLKKKMKTMKAQERRLDKAEKTMTAIPEKEEGIEIWFDKSVALPAKKRVMDFTLEALTIADRQLSGPIDFTVMGQEKVVITGPNGSGKTTLLKAIYRAFNGRDDISVGYMPQDYHHLFTHQTVLEFLAVESSKEAEAKARKMLGALQFEREEMVKPTVALSGGQKAKLYFLKMVLDQNNVLLLDEPTRNLSPLNMPEIARLLKEFQGSIIAVSHDRAFIEAVFDTMVHLDKNGLKKV